MYKRISDEQLQSWVRYHGWNLLLDAEGDRLGEVGHVSSLKEYFEDSIVEHQLEWDKSFSDALVLFADDRYASNALVNAIINIVPEEEEFEKGSRISIGREDSEGRSYFAAKFSTLEAAYLWIAYRFSDYIGGVARSMQGEGGYIYIGIDESRNGIIHVLMIDEISYY